MSVSPSTSASSWEELATRLIIFPRESWANTAVGSVFKLVEVASCVEYQAAAANIKLTQDLHRTVVDLSVSQPELQIIRPVVIGTEATVTVEVPFFFVKEGYSLAALQQITAWLTAEYLRLRAEYGDDVEQGSRSFAHLRSWFPFGVLDPAKVLPCTNGCSITKDGLLTPPRPVVLQGFAGPSPQKRIKISKEAALALGPRLQLLRDIEQSLHDQIVSIAGIQQVFSHARGNLESVRRQAAYTKNLLLELGNGIPEPPAGPAPPGQPGQPGGPQPPAPAP